MEKIQLPSQLLHWYRGLGQLDLTDLRDQFNAYSSTTGISAQLSADKASLMLVQDEGLDIIIENVDFAGVTTNVDTTRFVEQQWIRHKLQQVHL